MYEYLHPFRSVEWNIFSTTVAVREWINNFIPNLLGISLLIHIGLTLIYVREWAPDLYVWRGGAEFPCHCLRFIVGMHNIQLFKTSCYLSNKFVILVRCIPILPTRNRDWYLCQGCFCMPVLFNYTTFIAVKSPSFIPVVWSFVKR